MAMAARAHDSTSYHCLQGRASGSSPAYHSGRHIELSDTEVDAVAAFPAFRHAVKSRGWGGNAEVEATESDEDAGLYGYGFEGKQTQTSTTLTNI